MIRISEGEIICQIQYCSKPALFKHTAKDGDILLCQGKNEGYRKQEQFKAQENIWEYI